MITLKEAVSAVIYRMSGGVPYYNTLGFGRIAGQFLIDNNIKNIGLPQDIDLLLLTMDYPGDIDRYGVIPKSISTTICVAPASVVDAGYEYDLGDIKYKIIINRHQITAYER